MGEQKMTPGIRRWLERLANDGPAHRDKGYGSVAYRSMLAGWTDWLMIYKPTGERVLWRQHKAETDAATFGDYENVPGHLEAITDAGRAALAATKQEAGNAD